MKIKKLTLLVATLALVLGLASSAVAQVADEPPAQDPQTEEPPAHDPAAHEPQAQETPTQEAPAEVSCADIFRQEQTELAQTGVYPTSVSEQARACEDSGEYNPYPAPYFYDSEGFLYIFDPVADVYWSTYDPVAGVYYIYDLTIDDYYTYDPSTGTFA